jgi:hypothetical protein
MHRIVQDCALQHVMKRGVGGRHIARLTIILSGRGAAVIDGLRLDTLESLLRPNLLEGCVTISVRLVLIDGALHDVNL